jgi:hypothetical protein
MLIKPKPEPFGGTMTHPEPKTQRKNHALRPREIFFRLLNVAIGAVWILTLLWIVFGHREWDMLWLPVIFTFIAAVVFLGELLHDLTFNTIEPGPHDSTRKH